MSEIIKKVDRATMSAQQEKVSPGDTVSVSLRIREGDKERVQSFQGVVIQSRGSGMGKTITVRKVSGGVYVERIFPYYSPLISEIKTVRRGKTRRAKLYYLRKLSGKSTRIKEDKALLAESTATAA
ncbi:MAG: 50S ribosomal protein L19 [Chitinivibrionales bacterium]|nr:50S ribosomal protein L19 [Chitinivibrionales bacterium]